MRQAIGPGGGQGRMGSCGAAPRVFYGGGGLSHLGQRDRGPDASLGAEGHEIDPTALGQPARFPVRHRRRAAAEHRRDGTLATEGIKYFIEGSETGHTAKIHQPSNFVKRG